MKSIVLLTAIALSASLISCGSGSAGSDLNHSTINASSFIVKNGSLNQSYNSQISNYTIKFESSINVCGENAESIITSCFMIESQELKFGYTTKFYLNQTPITLKRVESDFPDILCQNKNTIDDGSTYLITPYSFVTVDHQDAFAPVNYLVALTNQCYPIWYQRLIGSHGYDLKLADNNTLIYKNMSNVDGALVDNIQLLNNTSTVYLDGKDVLNDMHDVIYMANKNYINLFNNESTNQFIDESGTVGDIFYTSFSTSQGETIFRAIDYYNVSDILDQSEVNYVVGGVHYTNLDHGNSIAYTNDGNIVYNSRNTSSILKINPQNGNVIWQFGGLRNQFMVLNDPLYPFMYEHFVRQLPNGNYMVFDNGTSERGYSRVVEYFVDETNMTATLVWQFIDPRHIFAQYMGNGERLQDGNTVINYGTLSDKTLPQVEEVEYSGNVINQIFFPDKTYSYRAYKVNLPPSYRDLVMPTEDIALHHSNYSTTKSVNVHPFNY